MATAASTTAPTTSPPARPLSKTEKAAVLLLCMDEQSSGQLMSNLRDEEIRKVGSALLRLKEIPAAQIQQVIAEFAKEIGDVRMKFDPSAIEAIQVDGKKVTERFLSRTLSRGKSQEILLALKGGGAAAAGDSIDLRQFVNQQTPETLYAVLAKEHLQVVALVLALAKRNLAKAVMAKFTDEQRAGLLSRMAGIEKVNEAMTREVAGFLAKACAARESQKGTPAEEAAATTAQEMTVDGMENTVKLLKTMPPEAAQKIIDGLTAANPELGAKIAKRMFIMEDLERSDDAGIRELLRNVTNDDLKASLKNAAESLQNRFFKNMSERAALIMREDMDVMPPLKVEEIEAAQERILAAAKKLMSEDKLKLTAIVEEEEA